MDLISEAINYLTDTRLLHEWPEAAQIVQHLGSHPSNHWRIPGTVCLAVGGDSEQALPGVAALIALHTSIVMVDDLLDGDDRFTVIGWKHGDLANLAQALTVAGFDAILHGPFAETTKNTVVLLLNRMIFQTATGQFLDTHRIIHSEAEYWQVVRAKSAPFFETAFAIGAVLGGARPEMVTALRQVGFLYGEMIQIHDDLKDALVTPASPDWKNGGSLPILFASDVIHPDRDLFLQLKQDLDVPDSLREAHKILLRSGAISYCMKQLIDRSSAAKECLNNLLLADHRLVNELLDQMIWPVRKIIKNLAIQKLA